MVEGRVCEKVEEYIDRIGRGGRRRREAKEG